MCLETARVVIWNGPASSPTDASPFKRCARMARLVGSASAAKVVLSWSCGTMEPFGCGTNRFYNKATVACQEIEGSPLRMRGRSSENLDDRIGARLDRDNVTSVMLIKKRSREGANEVASHVRDRCSSRRHDLR